MIKIVGRFDQRRPMTHIRVGDANTINSGAEVNFLSQRCRRRRPQGVPFAPVRRFTYVTYEPNTLSRNSTDQALVLAAVSNGFAHGIDTAGECGVRHDPAAPDRSNQIVPTDDAVAVADQK